MKGLVKWFSNDKGYGFITSESGQDYYFNVQSILGADLPSNGDSVEFSEKQGNKGPRAVNISIKEKAPEKHQARAKADDRITCPGCNKKIVPRMITYRGDPQKSVCPYCATTVRVFTSNIIGYVIVAVVLVFFLFAIFS